MERSGVKAKRIAAASVFTALMVVLIYLSAFFPTMSMSIIALAGVVSAVLVSEYGLATAAMAYASASVLALILVPDKSNAVLFAIMFGIYPIIQNLIEHVKYKWLTWCTKITVANLMFFITWILFKKLFFTETEFVTAIGWVLLMGANAVFVMYDICLKKLVIFYKIRVANRIR